MQQQKFEVSNTSQQDKSAAKVSSEVGSRFSNISEQQQQKSPAQVSSKSQHQRLALGSQQQKLAAHCRCSTNQQQQHTVSQQNKSPAKLAAQVTSIFLPLGLCRSLVHFGSLKVHMFIHLNLHSTKFFIFPTWLVSNLGPS